MISIGVVYLTNGLQRHVMGESLTDDSNSPDFDSEIWSTFLKCYVCENWFKNPRILPCGHTFCSTCLSQLRNQAAQEWRIKYPLGHRRGECGYFSCPMPECHYSMKLMNLSRWSVRNRAVSDALRVFQREMGNKQISQTSTSDTEERQQFLDSAISSVSQVQSDVVDGNVNRNHPSCVEKILQRNFGVTGWKSFAVVCWMQMLGEVLTI